MNLDFMVDKAVANILSVNGKEKTSQVIRQEINQIIELAKHIGWLNGTEDTLNKMTKTLNKKDIDI